MRKIVLDWLNSNDTGISSCAIVARLEGVYAGKSTSVFGNHPHDPSDLGRCIRLLNHIPDYRPRLSEMREESRVWAKLVEHWDELERLYYVGLASKEKRAPECHNRMKALIAEAEGNDDGT